MQFSCLIDSPVLSLMEAKDKLQTNINNSFTIMWDCGVGPVLSSVTSPCTLILKIMLTILLYIWQLLHFVKMKTKGLNQLWFNSCVRLGCPQWKLWWIFLKKYRWHLVLCDLGQEASTPPCSRLYGSITAVFWSIMTSALSKGSTLLWQ